VIAATLLMLFVERMVVTPSEELEESLTTLMAALKANDLPGVLAQIDPSAASVRGDAETLMPQVNVKDTGFSAVRVEVAESSTPPRATVFFRGRIDGMHAHSGARLFFFDKVEIEWQKRGDQWLVTDYRAEFRGKPVKASEGLRGIR
jgi:hypothetical protein